MNKNKLPSEIYSHLRSRILGFKLLPGVKISDQEIAKELGTSRTPVREALIRLVNHGLVSRLHNKGFTVREFSIKDVEDIYILREALERLSVKLAIKNFDKQKIKQLKSLIDCYPDLITTGNRNEFNKADEEFHMLIAEYSNNQPLTAQLNSLHDQLAVLRRYAHLLSNRPRDAYEEETYIQHLEIFGHMVKNDHKAAMEAMSAHVRASMGSVIDTMQQNLN
jgi:DNA-binding GntR family transcriptional regulator